MTPTAQTVIRPITECGIMFPQHILTSRIRNAWHVTWPIWRAATWSWTIEKISRVWDRRSVRQSTCTGSVLLQRATGPIPCKITFYWCAYSRVIRRTLYAVFAWPARTFLIPCDDWRLSSVNNLLIIILIHWAWLYSVRLNFWSIIWFLPTTDAQIPKSASMRDGNVNII